MLCGVSDFIDGAIESCLVGLGRFRETAQLPDELERRSANLIRRRRWTEVMKCFDRSAHVRTINTSRSRINSFLLRKDSLLFCYADILGLGEEPQCFFAAFAADAALLHSTKGDAQIAYQPAVHPHRTSVDSFGDAMSAIKILCPDAGRQAVLAIVSVFDHFFFVIE